jgi:hypothetical protein
MSGFRLRPWLLLTASLYATLLSACASGGGGSPASPSPPATPLVPPAPPPPPPPPPVTPSVTGAEYKLNPGLGFIHPEAAWAAGATGAGQIVAVIDSGVDTSSPDLTGRVSSDSTDLVTSRTSTAITGRHGTEVATVLAAGFNGFGQVGVAYGATILSVRVDEPGTCSSSNGCSFNTTDIATGLDYAVAHGAKIINLSLGLDTPSPVAIQQALQRAVAAGAVIVAAAGNDGPSAPNPIYPAAFASDSRYVGSIIAAGALNAAGTDIASFSNRAGSAANDFLLAPGENVTADCTTAGCSIVDGTSFAAPHIAGALALLLSGFPNLTGAQAVDILLRTADDLGAPGTDPIYGRGMLDIARAFAPVGSLSLASASGGLTPASTSGGGTLTAVSGQAFGLAFKGLTNLKTVGFDDYRRMYPIDLSSALTAMGRRSAVIPSDGPVLHSTTDVTTRDGGHLTLAAQTAIEPLVDTGGPSELLQQRRPNAVQADYQSGNLAFSLWSGQQGYAPSAVAAPADAFSQLAFAQQTGRVSFIRGRWTLSAEQGFGDRGDTPGVDFAENAGLVAAASTAYSRFVAQTRHQDWTLTLGLGLLSETGGPLGSLMPQGSAYAMPASTRYLMIQGEWRIAPGLTLVAKGAVGSTHAQGAALSLDATSSTWAVEADAACRAVCSGLFVSLSQPVRVERGALAAYLAEQPAQYLDPLVYSWRTATAAPDGRELDWGVGLWRNLGGAVLRVEANAFADENNRRDLPLNLGLTASLASRF